MIKWILTHFFLFCLLLVGSVFYYLTMTTPGLQTDIQIITKMFAGKLRIKSASGQLIPHFTLKNVTWRDDSKTLHIQSVSVTWNPRPVITASIDHISIPNLGVTLRNIHLNGIISLAKISPDITFNFIKKNITLQGTILIPDGEITPQNVNGTVGLPDDVVIVGAKKTTDLPFTPRLKLKVELGNNIHLIYHNLETYLTGHVELTQSPGTLINAVGELHTEKGIYKAYGQTLKIKKGRLIYTGGSVMNPGLDVLTVKKIKTVNTGGNVSSFSGKTSLDSVYTGTQTITVGVEVVGTLDNPIFNLYSSPSMAQADILSYLVFGFPQSQANGNQYGAILSALSSLNPSTANAGNFTKNLREKWGLTEMTVESVQVFNPNATSSSNSVVSATSFVVGKKLSNKLSIHYSIGLFYPISILNLRYQLGKHWAIQSETSTLDNGGDILYTIESD